MNRQKKTMSAQEAQLTNQMEKLSELINELKAESDDLMLRQELLSSHLRFLYAVLGCDPSGEREMSKNFLALLAVLHDDQPCTPQEEMRNEFVEENDPDPPDREEPLAPLVNGINDLGPSGLEEFVPPMENGRNDPDPPDREEAGTPLPDDLELADEEVFLQCGWMQSFTALVADNKGDEEEVKIV